MTFPFMLADIAYFMASMLLFRLVINRVVRGSLRFRSRKDFKYFCILVWLLLLSRGLLIVID